MGLSSEENNIHIYIVMVVTHCCFTIVGMGSFTKTHTLHYLHVEISENGMYVLTPVAILEITWYPPRLIIFHVSLKILTHFCFWCFV